MIDIASVADPERPVALDQMINHFGTGSSTHKPGPAWGKLLLISAVIAALAATWHFTPVADYLTAERVMGWAHDFAEHPWSPLVVLAAYTPACLVMFPRPLITLFAVVAFGPWLGFAYAMSGILIAALVTYFVGKVLDYSTVRNLAGEKLNRVSVVLRKRGLVACTVLRLVPLAPFAIEGIIAGAIGIKLWHFMLGTFIGMLPGTLIATIFSDQIETALRDPWRINYWIVGAVLALAVGASFAVRRWFMKNMPVKPASAASKKPG